MQRYRFRRFNKELGFMQPVSTPDEGDMQFIGLFDKNYKDIYEHDLVKFAMWDKNHFVYEVGVIKWHQQSSAFKWFSLVEHSADVNDGWMSQADSLLREVVGNIYEDNGLHDAVVNGGLL